MLRQTLSALIIFFALFCTEITVKADHLSGADITYTCIGQDSFLVTLTIFRDCSGILLDSLQTIAVTAPGCGTHSFTVLRDTFFDITPICPGGTSPCDNPSSPLPLGLEKHIFHGIWAVASGTSCTKWTLSYLECCRIEPAHGGDMFYISSQLSTNLSACNNSPVFTNPIVPFICTDLPFNYNPGVFDPDGDSLVFSLVPCLTSDSTTISYLPGQTPQQFLLTNTPITLDSINGTIYIEPSISQIGFFAIKVEEYRDGVKIGEVTRDMVIVVTNCNNQPPQVSGINGSTDYDMAVCPGQSISFDVFSNDSTPFQDVTMTWNEGIPNATFNISGSPYPQGHFSWNTSTNDIGTHFFTVNVVDDGCPVTSQRYFAYTIHVRNPQIDLPEQLFACNGNPAVLDSSQVHMSVDFVHFTWSPAGGFPPPDPLNVAFNPSAPTMYTLTATNGFCTAIDAMLVVPTTIDTSVTNLNDTLRANLTNATYQWVDCDNGNAPIAGATHQTFRPGVSGNYAVLVDNDTCSEVSGCHQVIVVGLVNPDKKCGFQLYPNPSNGTVRLESSGNAGEPQRLRVFDISGREVFRQSLAGKTDYTLTFDLPDGLYSVVLETETERTTKTLAIVR